MAVELEAAPLDLDSRTWWSPIAAVAVVDVTAELELSAGLPSISQRSLGASRVLDPSRRWWRARITCYTLRMSLALLHTATLTRPADAPYFERVRHWQEKQQMLVVAVEDLDRLVADYHEARRTAQKYELDPRISLPEPRPRLRLAMAVEAVCSCVYAMTEVAANFANRLTAKGDPEGQLPGSFRSIKDRIRDGKFSALATQLGDFAWHDNLHAMRTEWVHFSTIFIAEENDGQPIVCGRALRAPSDKTVLKSEFQFRLADVRTLAEGSITSLDRFAMYLLPRVIAKFDLSMELLVPLRDANGLPILRDDFRFEVKTITVREHLHELGLGAWCAAEAATAQGSDPTEERVVR